MGVNNKGGHFFWKLVPLIILLIGAFAFYKTFGPNAIARKYLYVKTGSTYADIINTLSTGGYLQDASSFDVLAKAWKLPTRVHAGRYEVKKGMSNFELVRKLRNGSQAEVKLVIHKLRTRQDFIRLLAANMEIDSTTLTATFNDPAFLASHDLDSATFMCAIMPNTYRFYWNNSFDKVFGKIYKNYQGFWNTERKQKATAMSVSPVQAVIIASIIEEETNLTTDKPLIASVYLNRLKRGMKLQADPTVKFAIGDFSIKRITGAMLQTASPYNTYQNEGLPPGPICTPSPATIDAVLNAPETKYIYFCAKDDLSGASVFAETGEEHMKNARLYQKALNARGIH